MHISLLVVLAAILITLTITYFAVSIVITNIVAAPSLRSMSRTPASLGIPFEDVSFPSRKDNLTLKGWLIESGARGTIIIAHGGKTNRADRGMLLLEMCIDLAKKGFNILTFDRRGCGESATAPLKNRAHLERDIAGAVDYVRSRKGPEEDIFLLGFSLGAVATILFASQETGINGIICDSCFVQTPETIKRILNKVNRWLPVFMPGSLIIGRLVYGFKPVDMIDKVSEITCPVFFINGQGDDAIPPINAHQLFKASSHPLSEIWVVPRSNHVQAYMVDPQEYIERITCFFLSRCSSRRALATSASVGNHPSAAIKN